MKKCILWCLLVYSVILLSTTLTDKNIVCTLLAEMVAKDQELRSQIDFSHLTENDTQKMVQMNQKHAQVLKQILDAYEWITISEFGAEADHNAWLLAQHADHDVQFQKNVLQRLEKLSQLHETNSANYAYLFDRIAKNENRPQRYGTQGDIVQGQWVTYPIEDESALNERRQSVGLMPFSEYLETIGKIFHL